MQNELDLCLGIQTEEVEVRGRMLSHMLCYKTRAVTIGAPQKVKGVGDV